MEDSVFCRALAATSELMLVFILTPLYLTYKKDFKFIVDLKAGLSIG